MLLKNKLDNIKTLLEADNVLATLEERYCYAKDASNLKRTFKIPDIVVFVEDIEDVQKVVKYANLHDVPIIPRGAGTNMVGACVCEQGGIVLNFSKMNKILEINPINMTATVQPGVVVGDLKSKVEALNSQYDFFKEVVWVQRGLVNVNWTKADKRAKDWINTIKETLPAEEDFTL